MTSNALLQLLVFIAVLLLLAQALGPFLARVYEGQSRWVNRFGVPLERWIYRLAGVDATTEMRWTQYALAMLLFNLVGMVIVYGMQRLQMFMPLNPQTLVNVSPDSSFNTAVSFVTNTNWQGYSGEATMSYLTQMLGLAVQNFLSAATGMAILIALIRGFVRHTVEVIGNFWVDLTRSIVYVLLPLSVILSVALVSQGTVQTFRPYVTVQLLQPLSYTQPRQDDQGNAIKDAAGQVVNEVKTLSEQTLALGPAAAQIAIKQLGTNGGGFFNANSAHPFENPTPLTNFLELLAILLIPAALCITFGKMVGDLRQGWVLLLAMTIVFVPMLGVTTYEEQHGKPVFNALGIDQAASAQQAGGNMEGKETRFGIANSALWATATTSASNGSVNSMHDSFTPLGGMVPMWMIQLGEVIFGGVGSGLYGMLMFALLAVFVAGLMIGRTPEYLGKKIEAFEIKMASIIILITPLLVLLGTAVAVSVESGTTGIANPGAHGFSEILYAFSSASNNNGSAFAGLSANTPFYNSALGLAMLFGRYWIAVPVLAIAGALASKKRVSSGLGTLPTHTPLFVGLLLGTVVLVGALTYVPALALGPVVEQYQMTAAASD